MIDNKIPACVLEAAGYEPRWYLRLHMKCHRLGK